MRPLIFARMPNEKAEEFAERCFRMISDATHEDIDQVFEVVTVSNFTPTRTLDASTATVSDIANFLATIVDDIKKRGQD